MASQKEIKDRMKSIQDTLKITNAMYMISSSKLRKAKKTLADTEPYFYTLNNAMTRILRHVPDMDSVYFRDLADQKPEELTIGYVVITSDKGMAGAYNQNILKIANEELKKTPNHKLYVLGEIGRHYFERHQVKIDGNFRYTIQQPTMARARRMGEDLLQEYLDGEIDALRIIYTRMENSVESSAEMMELLPLKKADFTVEIPAGVAMEDIVFEPSPEKVMEQIVPDYIIGFMYSALVEAFASVQNARMMAMQASSDSAKKMLAELGLAYNRARQAAITQEITEVAAGAKAQKRKTGA
ncbi:MAG: ATP synthase F1 subunit gamma [Lachnospiraceae bacterium]|jgi:F-type H+-transporting ATPase subunit gamma|nr:ATP synthase F1 subunit gamma [Lachnospiraceae bacterium]